MRKLLKSILLRFSALISHDNSTKIIFYHDVGVHYTNMGTSKELFWQHWAIQKKEKSFHTIAFDDGFHGIWEEREHFAQEHLCPIVFIAIDLVGKPGYLTWEEILILQNEYGFSFQSHTWSHQTLAGPENVDLKEETKGQTLNRDDTFYHHEIVDSKLELEKHLGRTVDSLCFPVGYFSDEVVHRAIDAGYSHLYTSIPYIPLSLSFDPHLHARVLAQFASPFDFKSMLHGGLNLFAKRYINMHYIQ